MTRSATGLDLQCKNGTVIIKLGKNVFYNETLRTFKVVARHEGSDQQAVWYIVVVLLFYSVGIIIAIVTYLKRERAEIEEQKSYEDYFNFKLDPGRHSRYYRVKQVAMQLKLLEEERQKRNRIPLEKDRPRKHSKKRYGRSHSWHFGTLSPFASPSRSPTHQPSILHNLRLTLPASLVPPGLPTRQALSLNVTPTSPKFSSPFLQITTNAGERRARSLNPSPVSSPQSTRRPVSHVLFTRPDICIDSPASTPARHSSLTSSSTDIPTEMKGTTAVVYRCSSPEFRRTLVTNL